jgi:hypothetical protein
MNRVGFVVSEDPELNSSPVTMCSLISSLVYFIRFSSYRVLNNDLKTIVFLYFFTYTLLVYKSI